MDTLLEEIQENLFQITLFPEESPIGFNHYLIRDTRPTLIHTGHQQNFEILLAEVKKLIDPSHIQCITFSHVESDECGSLNQWLKIAPNAKAYIGKLCNLSIQDFVLRPAVIMKEGESLSLGQHTLQLLETPHFPHNWDACLWYETHTKTLFGSDLGTQLKKDNLEPLIRGEDQVERILALQEKIGYMAYGSAMDQALKKLQQLPIQRLAVMHGNILDESTTGSLLSRLDRENQKACKLLVHPLTSEIS